MTRSGGDIMMTAVFPPLPSFAVDAEPEVDPRPDSVETVASVAEDAGAPASVWVSPEELAATVSDGLGPLTALAGLPGTVSPEPDVPQTAVAAVGDMDPLLPSERATVARFYLQLVSLESQDRVQSEWLRLQDLHTDVLGELRGDVLRADLGDHGVWYRLQAGPLISFDSAEAACTALMGAEQACIVVER